MTILGHCTDRKNHGEVRQHGGKMTILLVGLNARLKKSLNALRPSAYKDKPNGTSTGLGVLQDKRWEERWHLKPF
jgi:hypothetical protein